MTFKKMYTTLLKKKKKKKLQNTLICVQLKYWLKCRRLMLLNKMLHFNSTCLGVHVFTVLITYGGLQRNTSKSFHFQNFP